MALAARTSISQAQPTFLKRQNPIPTRTRDRPKPVIQRRTRSRADWRGRSAPAVYVLIVIGQGLALFSHCGIRREAAKGTYPWPNQEIEGPALAWYVVHFTKKGDAPIVIFINDVTQ